ncbi:hypothetical protein BC628DRAFT_792499 [Trametes gibbosa]|nr:hypothetical protein BC628DRAFT_792499 [Trametes gibbosa]
MHTRACAKLREERRRPSAGGERLSFRLHEIAQNDRTRVLLVPRPNSAAMRRMCQRVPVQRFKAERRRAHAMSRARGAHPPGAVSRCDTRPKRRPRYRRRTRTGLSVVPCGAYGPTSVRGRAARTVYRR